MDLNLSADGILYPMQFSFNLERTSFSDPLGFTSLTESGLTASLNTPIGNDAASFTLTPASPSGVSFQLSVNYDSGEWSLTQASSGYTPEDGNWNGKTTDGFISVNSIINSNKNIEFTILWNDNLSPTRPSLSSIPLLLECTQDGINWIPVYKTPVITAISADEEKITFKDMDPNPVYRLTEEVPAGYLTTPIAEVDANQNRRIAVYEGSVITNNQPVPFVPNGNNHFITEIVQTLNGSGKPLHLEFDILPGSPLDITNLNPVGFTVDNFVSTDTEATLSLSSEDFPDIHYTLTINNTSGVWSITQNAVGYTPETDNWTGATMDGVIFAASRLNCKDVVFLIDWNSASHPDPPGIPFVLESSSDSGATWTVVNKTPVITSNSAMENVLTYKDMDSALMYRLTETVPSGYLTSPAVYAVVEGGVSCLKTTVSEGTASNPAMITHIERVRLVPSADENQYSLDLDVIADGVLTPLHIEFKLRHQAGSGLLKFFDISASNLTYVTGTTTSTGGTITIIPDFPSTVRFTLTVNENGKWTLSQASAGYVPPTNRFEGTEPNGEIKVSSSIITGKDVIFSIFWNDNISTSRPDINKMNFKLEYYDPVSGEWVETAKTPVISTASTSENRLTYKDLDASLQYRLTETVPAGYITQPAMTEDPSGIRTVTIEEGTGGTIAMLTNNEEIEVSLKQRWNDITYASLIRPSTADFAGSFTLKRYSNDPRNIEVIGAVTPTITETDASNWIMDFGDFENYDPNGFAYNYIIEENSSGWENAGTYGKYVQAFSNTDHYQNEKTTIFNGATLSSTITQNIDFEFSKSWADGNTAPDKRPNATFRLYRYPNDGNHNPDKSSPVKGMDSMTISRAADKTDNQPFTYTSTNGQMMPRYDTFGYEYVYFISESFPGDVEEYETRVRRNGVLEDTNVILPGDEVVNLKRGFVNPKPFVTWAAAQIRSHIDGSSVTLDLYRQSQGNPPERVHRNAVTVTGFTGAVPLVQGKYNYLQEKYDPDGYPYTYYFVETGGEFDNENYTVSNDHFTIAGNYEFAVENVKVTDPTTDEEVTAIQNRLVGTTEMRVTKKWNPALPDGTSGSARINFYYYTQTGTVTVPLTNVTSDTAVISGNYATFTDSALFQGLPKYDSEGAAITYLVNESPVGASGYSFAGVTYKTNDAGIREATVTNAIVQQSPYLQFSTTKIWNDNNDVENRRTVTMGIFYKDSTVPRATFNITANNGWYGSKTIALSGLSSAEEKDISNWSIREYSIVNPVSGGEAFSVTYTDPDNGVGTVSTDQYNYNVTHGKATISGDPGKTQHMSRSVTNSITGDVSIKITKDWKINNATWVGETGPVCADFKLTKYNSIHAVVEETPVQICKDEGSATSELILGPFDVYDSSYKTYTFAVSETGLSQGTKKCYFQNGICDFGGYEIIKDETDYQYIVGPRHTNNQAQYTFENKLSQTVSHLIVNTVWRDNGNSQTIMDRPDITLRLWQIEKPRSEVTSADLANAVEITTARRDWDTTRNNWFWVCDFGELPVYDSLGNEQYTYLVTLDYPHSRDFATTYYIGNVQPNAAGTDSMSTFSEASNSQFFTIAGVSANGTAGTIFSTKKELIDLSYTKVWRDLPAWFEINNVATVYFHLYRVTDPSVLDKTSPSYDPFNPKYRVLDDDGNPVYRSVANGGNTFSFTGIPAYDDFGIPYIYYPCETNDPQGLNIGGLFAFESTMSDPGAAEAMVNNRYTGGKNPLRINVTKTFRWTERNTPNFSSLFGTKSPAVTVSLHRVYRKNGNITNDTVIATQLIGAMDITDDTITKDIVFESTRIPDMVQYAPDESEYEYYVTESVLNAYAQTGDYITSDNCVPLALDAAGTMVGNVSLENTYDPKNVSYKVINKNWLDSSNRYGTRPLDPDDVIITLTRTPALPSDAITSSSKQTPDPGNPDRWTYTFNGTFPTYNTDDTSYRYSALESAYGDMGKAPKGYTSTVSGMTITNTLRTVPVILHKSWMAKVGDVAEPMSRPMMNSLHELGLIPNILQFDIQKYDPADPAADTDGYVTAFKSPYSVSFSDFYYLAAYGDPYTLDNDIPKYQPQTETPYRLRVIEHDTGNALFSASTPAGIDSDKTLDFSITNTLSTVNLTLKVEWDDDNNRDGLRPETVPVTVTLWDSKTSSYTGESYDEILSKSNNYTSKISIPFGAGYQIIEKGVNGYTISPSDGYTQEYTSNTLLFTDTHKPQTFNVNLSKDWQDNNNFWAERPSSVDAHLEYCADGDACDGTGGTWKSYETPSVIHTLTGSDWNTKWTDLPANIAKIVSTSMDQTWNPVVVQRYRVVEDTGTVNYVPSSDVFTSSSMNQVLTNTYETTELSVHKVWIDNNDRFGTRPAAATIKLERSQDGVNWQQAYNGAGTAVTLEMLASDNWADKKFEDLPKYYGSGSTDLWQYRAVEIAPAIPADYEILSSVTAPDKDGNMITTITNRLVTDIIVAKHWIDTTADENHPVNGITLNLSNGSNTFTYVMPNSETVHTYSKVPVFDADDTLLTYTLTENDVPYYYSEVVKTQPSGSYTPSFDVYNTRLIRMDVTKVWLDGGHADERTADGHVTFSLNGTPQTFLDQNGNPMDVSAGGWTGAIDQLTDNFTYTAYLPCYDHAGNALNYDLTEDILPTGYMNTGIQNTAPGAYTVTNQRKIDVNVSKNWLDGTNSHNRPPVTLDLTQVGTGVFRTEVLPADDELNTIPYTFTDLPKYNEGTAEPYAYYVTESYTDISAGNWYYTPPSAAVGNMTDGFIFTNTELFDIPVTTTWNDVTNRDNLRPAAGLDYTLEYQVSEEPEIWAQATAALNPIRITGSLTDNTPWEGAFTAVPKYDKNNQLIKYRVQQQDVLSLGYDSQYSGTYHENWENGRVFNLVVPKVWFDGGITSNRDPNFAIAIFEGTSPTAADTPVQIQTTCTLAPALPNTPCEYLFKGVPKYDSSGNELTYSVKEGTMQNGSFVLQPLKGYKTNSVTVPKAASPTDVNFRTSDLENTKALTICKVWDDGENTSFRPATVSVEVRLQDGTILYNGAISYNNESCFSFDGGDGVTPVITLFDVYGNEILYSITENAVIDPSAPSSYSYQTNVSGVRCSGGACVNAPLGCDYQVTNTLLVEPAVKKEWIAGSESLPNYSDVSVSLMNGTTVKETKAFTDSWNLTFTKVPAYNGTELIPYTVAEQTKNYKSEFAGDAKDGFTVTNTLIEPYTVTKIWDDGVHKADRGNTAEFVFTQTNGIGTGNTVSPMDDDGDIISNAVPTGSDKTETYIAYLPKYDKDGTPLTYSVDEINIPTGYFKIGPTLSDPWTITNQRVISIPVTKEWSDNNGADSIRPDVAIQLKQDGTEYGASVPLDPGNSYSHTFTDLPKYKDPVSGQIEGDAYVYTVSESLTGSGVTPNGTGYYKAADPVPASVSGIDNGSFRFTNTELIDISVKKTWADNNDADGLRPAAVTYTLTSDDGSAARTLSVDSSNDWKGTFSGQPKYNGSAEITYNVKEEIPTGYVLQMDASGAYVNSPAISVQLRKIWKDANDMDEERPDTIYFQITSNFTLPQTVELSGGNEEVWEKTVRNLPKYDPFGNKIVYTFTEGHLNSSGAFEPWIPNGYEETSNIITENTGNDPFYTVDVTDTLLTNLDVRKIWHYGSDAIPSITNIVLTPVGGGTPISATFNNVSMTAHFTNLHKYDDNGDAVPYIMSEDPVLSDNASAFALLDGTQITSRINSSMGTVIVTNTELIDIPVTKIWADNGGNDTDVLKTRPSDVTFTLRANGKTERTLTLDSVSYTGNTWTGEFSGLPKYDASNKPITYTVAETIPEGYSLKMVNNDFVNSAEVPVTITKTWKDGENKDGKRPSEISIRISSSYTGNKVITLTGGNTETWSQTVDLPKYDANDQLIQYTMTEGHMVNSVFTPWTPEGYELDTASITVLPDSGSYQANFLDILYTKLSVQKEWHYGTGSDADTIPSTSLSVTLTDSASVAVDTKDLTTAPVEFTHLRKYDDSNAPYSYTLSESPVLANNTISFRLPNGSLNTTGSVDTSMDSVPIQIINTELVTINVNKTWLDNANDDNKRPTELKFTLYAADTEYTGEYQVAVDPNPLIMTGGVTDVNWTGAFPALPKFDINNKKIAYRVQEEDLSALDYSSIVTGEYDTDWINDKVFDLTVPKYWNDGSIPDARDNSLALGLFRVEIDNSETLIQTAGTHTEDPTDPSRWFYLFPKVKKYYQDGNLIKYAVYEGSVDSTGAFTRGVPYGYAVNTITVDTSSLASEIKTDDLINTKVLTVCKVWKDGDNAESTRPATVSLDVTESGGTSVNYVIAYNSSGCYAFDGSGDHALYPLYGSDKARIAYSLTESAAAQGTYTSYSYETSTEDCSGTGSCAGAEVACDYQFTNTLMVQPVVTKSWIAGTETIPAISQVKVSLYNGTDLKQEKPFDSEWTLTFDKVPAYSGTALIPYTIKENLQYYQPEITGNARDGYALKNTLLTPVTVTKNWLDGGHDSERGTNGKFTVYQNNVAFSGLMDQYGGALPNAEKIGVANPYSITVYVPKYDSSGNLLDYSVKETTPATGYRMLKTEKTSSDDTQGFAYSITNERVISIPVTKIWQDGTGTHNRPDLTLTLKQNGVVYGSPSVMTAQTGNSVSYTFTDLPKYQESASGPGDAWVYSVVESLPSGYVPDPNGYYVVTSSVPADNSGTDFAGFTFTNKQLLDIPVSKTWNDKLTDDTRPTPLNVKLYRTFSTGTEQPLSGKELNLTAAEGWAGTFTGLDKYDTDNKAITYRVEETVPTGYTVRKTGTWDNELKNISEKTIEVTKAWVSGSETRPDDIYLRVCADGTPQLPVRISGTDPSYTFRNLPMYQDDGTEIEYTVEEIVPDGKGGFNVGAPASYRADYSAIVCDSATGQTCSMTITNVLLTGMQVQKVWYYASPLPTASLDVTLAPNTATFTPNGGWTGTRTPADPTDGKWTDTKELNAGNSWTVTYTDLQKYNEAGELITYTLTEDMSAYTGKNQAKLEYRDAAGNPVIGNLNGNIAKAIFINTETEDILVTKKWVDNSDFDGVRTDVTFELYADNVLKDSVTLPVSTTGDTWTTTFADLPKFDDSGKRIVYEVREVPLNSDYVLTMDGDTFVNSRVISLDVTKTWNDGLNADNVRPASIWIRISHNSIVDQTVEMTGGTNAKTWNKTITGLPKYAADGTAINYTVEEGRMVNGAFEKCTPTDYQLETGAITSKSDVFGGEYQIELTDTLYMSFTAEKEWHYGTETSLIPSVDLTFRLALASDSTKYEDKALGTASSVTFTPVRKYDDANQPIAYTLTEFPASDGTYEVTYKLPDGTKNRTGEMDTSISNVKVFNTLLFDIPVNALWMDNNDAEKVRPTTYVTVHLVPPTGALPLFSSVTPIQLTPSGWSGVFLNAPKYDDDNLPVAYSVLEDKIPFYNISYAGDSLTGFTVNNVHLRNINLQVKKEWIDGNNDQGIGNRPASIYIQLMNNGAPEISKTTQNLNPGNNWTTVFIDLPRYDNTGEPIMYTIRESLTDSDYKYEGIPGYRLTQTEAAPIDGDITSSEFFIKADNILIKDIAVEKFWNFLNGIPASVSSIDVSLGTQNKSLIALNGWKTVFTVDKYDASGILIEYPISETLNTYTGKNRQEFTFFKPDGSVEQKLTGNVSRVLITNTAQIDIPVTKTWIDRPENESRPAFLTFDLFRTFAGQPEEAVPYRTITVTPDPSGKWEGIFTDLDECDGNTQAITYRVAETPVNGYVSESGGTWSNDWINIRVKNIMAANYWVAGSEKLPEKVYFRLNANGAVHSVIPVTAAESWAHEFSHLKMYDNSGNPITYTVEEVIPDGSGGYIAGAPAGYRVEESPVTCNTQGTECSMSMKNVLMTSIEAIKNWNYGPDTVPENLVFTMKSPDGTTLSSLPVDPAVLSVTFTDLDKYNEDGTPITYHLSETSVPDHYDTVFAFPDGSSNTTGDVSSLQKSVTVINTEYIDIPVTKRWEDAEDKDGLRRNVTFTLSQNGMPLRKLVLSKSDQVGSDFNRWAGTYTDLLKYDLSGKKYVYEVTEESLDPDYFTSPGSGVNEFVNSRSIDIPVIKIWDDGNNVLRKRPSSITLYLNGGAQPMQQEITAPNWAYTFRHLPKYDPITGDAYEYTISEQPLPDYETEINGFEIKNLYPADVILRKTWMDANDADKLRPKSLHILLYANGVLAREQDISVNDFPYRYSMLPRFDAQGKEIVYTISETVPNGYALSLDGFSMTNTRVIDIPFKVTWVDGNNAEQTRPSEITVEVLNTNTGQKAAEMKLSASNHTDVFKNLPKYGADGKQINYILQTASQKDYRIDTDGAGITLTLMGTPRVTKVWIDGKNREGKRPASIQIELSDGSNTLETVTLMDTYLSHSFGTYPKYDLNDNRIHYRVSEQLIESYGTVLSGDPIDDGTVIENTLLMDLMTPKRWIDNLNEYETRPDFITIHLFADGALYRSIDVTRESGWYCHFKDVPVYRPDDEAIVYTVEEEPVENYTTEINGFQIINTLGYVSFIPNLSGILELTSELPETGFSSFHSEMVSEQPASIQYKPTGVHLEIPILDVSADFMEIPFSDGKYSVTWLGNSIGIPEGSAYPGEGQTLLAAHNHVNTTEAGPFYGISHLEENDRIFVTNEASDMVRFKVYANSKIAADDFESLYAQANMFENSMTLLTCEDEIVSGGYASRRIISAVPIEGNQ